MSISVPDFLVTGTDTGVGKTAVASALLYALRAHGVRAIGFKPAQTGSEEGRLCDADLLATASADNNPLADPLLNLKEALAPAVAADRAGVQVSSRDIEARIELLRRDDYTVVVEGAGGLMVPLVWNYTVVDLAQRFGLEAVIVARAGLGTLNHIILTAAMLQSRRIPIRAVVLNGRKDPPDIAESTNPAALRRMLPGPILIEAPHAHGATINDVVSMMVPFMRRIFDDT